MIKILPLVVLVMLLVGCSEKPSKEYKEFVELNGASTRIYCEDGFTMRETFLTPEATAPQVYLINSQLCKEYK